MAPLSGRVSLLATLIEIERQAVHTPALAAGIARAIVEQVSEMRAATRTSYLGADHTVGAVLVKFNSVR